jgi:type II secretory pathway pseudopilin PulG
MIELLATTAILVVLATLGFGAMKGMLDKGKMAGELGAAKNLITAYNLYAVENDGTYMAGMDNTVNSLWSEVLKKNVTGHPAQRYPFRLAPYFGNVLKGTIIVNQKKKQVAGEYLTSAFPTLGINYQLVGGLLINTQNGKQPQFGEETLTKAIQSPSSLLVFASGGSGDGAGRIEGFNILTPPYLQIPRWSTTVWDKNMDPVEHGHVDARFEGKAICAFTNGSIQLKTLEELSDMRLWSKNAAANDDPNYVPMPPVYP